MSSNETVTRASLRACEPITAAAPLAVLPDRVWTDEEWQRIRRGHLAGGAADKWSVFVEGDRLFAHRGWSGRGVYEAGFAPAPGGGWRITDAVVESDPELHPFSTVVRDVTMLQIIVSGVVLGIRDPGLWARWRDSAAAGAVAGVTAGS